MPRRAKGARLHWRDRKDGQGVWEIRDTGCIPFSTRTAILGEAEEILKDYIARKRLKSGSIDAKDIDLGTVLSIYADEYAHTVADPERIAYAIDALAPFWAHQTLDMVKGEACRQYAIFRQRADGTVRRELGTLQAAINYAHREGYISTAPKLTLPPKPESKERWLTRDEAAKLIWMAYRNPRTKHVARFILISLYTGTRKSAVLNMGFEKNDLGGWFDLENNRMFRRGDSERSTNKRRTPARIPRQLAGHLKRWKREGQAWPITYKGAHVLNIRKAFATLVVKSGVEDCTPHTLKHTAITWALQNGASIWDAAGFFATSVETIENTYGHHSPEFQESALRAIERR